MTLPDNYPIPNLQDFSSNLRNKTSFSKIDLVRAYNQIPMEEADIHKTAVATPFGLRNAAQTFQRFIDEVFQGLDCVFAYIDDILVASKNSEQNKKHLEQVFERLSFHGLIKLVSNVSSVLKRCLS